MNRLQQCIDALEAEKIDTEHSHGHVNHNHAIDTAIALITRILSAEPSDEEIDKCKWEISKVFVPNGIWSTEEGMKMNRAAKAALLTAFPQQEKL